MIIQAEVSLYPLKQEDLLRKIYEFVRKVERPGLRVEPGAMSTLVSGEADLLWEALREAHDATTADGNKYAVVIKIMN